MSYQGREWIKNLSLKEEYRHHLDALLSLIDSVNTEINILEKYLKQTVEESAEMKLLKTNFSLPLLITVLAAGLLLIGINEAKATTVTFAQDTTVDLGVGNITIEANSIVNEVITTNTTITISVISGQKIVLLSANKLYLDNDKGYTFICESNRANLTSKLLLMARDLASLTAIKKTSLFSVSCANIFPSALSDSF